MPIFIRHIRVATPTRYRWSSASWRPNVSSRTGASYGMLRVLWSFREFLMTELPYTKLELANLLASKPTPLHRGKECAATLFPHRDGWCCNRSPMAASLDSLRLAMLLTTCLLVLVEVSPSRPLGACWRQLWWMRTPFFHVVRLDCYSTLHCCTLSFVVLFFVWFFFSPPLTISTLSSAFFRTAANFSILWFLLKDYSMALPRI